VSLQIEVPRYRRPHNYCSGSQYQVEFSVNGTAFSSPKIFKSFCSQEPSPDKFNEILFLHGTFLSIKQKSLGEFESDYADIVFSITDDDLVINSPLLIESVITTFITPICSSSGYSNELIQNNLKDMMMGAYVEILSKGLLSNKGENLQS
jgi:hypothetical protein